MNINKITIIHNFHFVLNRNLKNKIIILSKKLRMSNSQTAIYILNKTLCILNKYQFDMQETEADLGYQSVEWDNDMHIYLEKALYRKIKHLADSIFAFSIAIVVRKLLELYFNFLEKSKGKIDRVERVFKRFSLLYINEYQLNKKVWNKEIDNEQLCGEFYYNLKFNDKFAIIGFNFNNFV